MILSSEQIKAYLQENPIDYGYDDIHSMLELLWRAYTQCNPIGTELIEAEFQQLGPLLKSMSRKRVRRIRCAMESLCGKYEREAFLAGVQAGLRLMSEVSELLQKYEPQ